MMLRLAAVMVIACSLTLTASAQTASPQADAILQAGLVKAMRLNAQRDARLTELGDGIRPYITAGYVRAKPELRED